MTTPKKATKFYKLNLPEILLTKDTPILKTYKTNRDFCQKKLT
jgi:hypothetical protein